MSGLGKGLRSLEVRTSPWTDSSSFLNFIDQAQQAFVAEAQRTFIDKSHNPFAGLASSWMTECQEPEFGMVFHFSKDRGGGTRDGFAQAHWVDSHANPDTRVTNPTGYRYARYYRGVRDQAQSLGWILCQFPLSLTVVRGIDICTDELGVPTWVFVPIFRAIRDYGQRVSAFLQRQCGMAVPPLRSTVHAGEDFVHLLGGLRRIDEVIRYLPLREGDRIGHAVALGINAGQWARSAGRVPVLREERLLDLTWEWMCYSHYGVSSDRNRLAYLDREIARLSNGILGESLTPFEVENFHHRLHQEPVLRDFGFPDGFMSKARPAPDTDDGRVYDWLTSIQVFKRGRETEWIDTEPEAEVLENLQQNLRQRVSSFGITIEINPTSNLLIGDLSDLDNHPLWRLRPPNATPSNPPIPICVGSDDPMTFATWLPYEYMLLHDTLVLGGQSHDQATRWIDEVRESGLDARFTLPRPGMVSNLNDPDISIPGFQRIQSLNVIGLENGLQPIL